MPSQSVLPSPESRPSASPVSPGIAAPRASLLGISQKRQDVGNGTRSRPRWRLYLLPFILTILLVGVRHLLDPVLGSQIPLILLFPAVAVSAFLGGWVPGLISLVLSLVLGIYLFIDPRYSFAIESIGRQFAVVVYLLAGFATCFISEWLLRLIEHNRREAAMLRHRENRLGLALDGAQDSLWDWDLKTGRTYRSDRWKQLRGFEPSEIGDERDDWLLFLHPEDRDRVVKAFQDHLNGRTLTYREEYRIRCKDGHDKWILDRGEAIRDEEGRAVRILGFETDVSLTKNAQLALDEARSQFEGIVATARDAIISVNETSEIVIFNSAAERLFQVTAADALGQNLERFIPENLRDLYEEQVKQNRERKPKDGTAFEMGELRALRPDGTGFPVEASVAQVVTSGRALFTLILRDISERKRAELLVARQAEALEMVAKGADLSDVLYLVCRTVEELTPSALCSVMLVEEDGRLHIAAAPSLPPSFAEALTSGVPISPDGGSCGRAAYLRKPVIVADIETDPPWRAYSETALRAGLRSCWSSPVLDPAGEPIGSLAIYTRARKQPTTADTKLIELGAHLVGIAVESHRSRQELSKSEERHRLALEAGQLGTWWHDVPTGLIHYDSRSREQCALDTSTLTIEQTILGMHPDDRQRVMNSMSTLLDPKTSKGVYTEEQRIILPDGSMRWLAVFGKVYFEGEGEERHAVRVVGANQDITERKLAEESLRENDRRKDEFLAMLAHELRNPLAAISSAVAILDLQQTTNPDLLWSREVIGWQVSHLARLVDDLLDVSRITRGKIKLNKVVSNINVIIQRAASAIQPSINEKHHELIVKLPSEPLVAEVDPGRFQQVLGNLLTNAVKYTDEGGQVTVLGEHDGNDVVITVSDTGVGISAENLPHIFSLFTQVDSSLARSQGGLGIGLTLVKRLVMMLGGSVVAKSDGLGQGSRFIVRIPASQKPIEEIDPETASRVQGSRAMPSRGRKPRKVMVVDDVIDTALGLGRLFENAGYEVRMAHDGMRAIEVAHEFHPDVILLDIGLPLLSGYEVAQRLRHEPEFANCQLIAISGYGQDHDRELSLAAGFNHHMTKPISFHAVQALLV